MDTRGLLTATCRAASVLAVAGVLAMHVLTTGHHAQVPAAGGHAAVMGSSVMGDAVMSSTAMVDGPVTSAPSGGPTLPEKLVEVCMAVLLVAATTLLLLLARTRRRLRPWSAASSSPLRWVRHVPSPRAPCLFTLGVLRT
ncbi:MAG: hypothetical protein LH461_05400 [Spirochaetaceae bacterium]|nr:hypothetical protein [Spirochaetaceae bacterium]